MKNEHFILWCHTAAEKIKYPPDRKMVEQELQDHLQDRYEALLERGISPADAEAQALSAMGSAEEIAPQLAAIHRPFLGYLHRIVKICSLCTALLAIFLLVACVWDLAFDIISSNRVDTLIKNYDETRFIYYNQPHIAANTEGYRMLIEEVALMDERSPFTGDYVLLQIRQTWWPFLNSPRYLQHMWAVDDLGNRYHALAEAPYDTHAAVLPGGVSHSGCYYATTVKITDFPVHEAKWVELHYNRDGRNIVIRIDLTGGEGSE